MKPWDDVIGQDEAVEQMRAAAGAPVHAYLLVGPRGSGKRAAARSFAAELLGPADRDVRLALEERHPDLVVFEPEGRSLRVGEAQDITKEAFRTPTEAGRKVVVIDRFHAAEPEAAASLLKTIEEPPPSTVLVLLAEDIPPEHVTVASRCVNVPFAAVPDDTIRSWLADQDLDAARIDEIAAAAAGDVRRARLLLADEQLGRRRQAWWSVPAKLDGTGSVVATLVDELRGLIDEAQAPLDARHADELAELARREEELGLRATGRREIDARQRREKRLLRDDELRFGFATLARRYRDADLGQADAVLARLRAANDALIRNPNETLLLQNLLLHLPRLR